MKKQHQGISLAGRDTTDNRIIGKVIAAQAKVKEQDDLVRALKRDRDDMLQEFTDLRNARPVHRSPLPKEGNGSGDRVRISFGDVHGMVQDPKAIAALLADVKTLRPDEIVLGGDIISCDGFLAKHQTLGFVANTNYSYQEDIEAGNALLDALQDAAPDAVIHYIEGNHEDRVERWVVDQALGHQRDSAFLLSLVSPKALLRLNERGITYYGRHDIHAEGLPRGWIRLGKMYFTHSLAYSKNAARDALQKTAGNVTYFCSHREDTASCVFPSVGLVKAFNPGCLCLMQPVYQNSNPTNWSQGYALDIIAPSGNFQRIHVPIWDGKSLAGSMVTRFRQ
jgi:hypothetical protein